MALNDVTVKKLVGFCTLKGLLYGSVGGLLFGLLFRSIEIALYGIGIGAGLGPIFGAINGVVLSWFARIDSRSRPAAFSAATIVTTIAVGAGLAYLTTVSYIAAFQPVSFLVAGAVFYGSPIILICAILLANSAAAWISDAETYDAQDNTQCPES